MRRLAIVTALAVGLTLLLAGSASAHPLGNFSVNQSSGIVVARDRITIDYVLDLAEIPTVEDRFIDAATECERVPSGLELRIDGAEVPLTVASSTLAFPPGQAGLDTTRLTCMLTAPAHIAGPVHIEFRNDRYATRVGWREITAAGDGTTLTTDLSPTSSTDVLRHYPKSKLGHPLDERTASIEAHPGGAPRTAPAQSSSASAARPESRGIDGLTASFTRLVGRQDLGLGIGTLAIVLAIALGSVHAFAPGHGKTVMAAYLVGRHGSLKQASIVALTVTATHTTGVLLLGVLVSSSALIAPERLYPWLGAVSGAMLVAIGATMLRAARRRRSGDASVPHVVSTHHQSEHGHDHAHAHRHHDHGHSHGGRWHTHAPAHVPKTAGIDRTGLLAMGFVGGLLPSPSALVVLLGAIALGHAWFGVVLVVAYGAGMALTLTTVGLVLVRGRDAISRKLPRLLALEAAMPVLTGAVVLVVGTLLAVRGLTAI